MSSLRFLLLLGALSAVFAAPAEDLVIDLPGLDFPINFDHYSGYLNATTDRFLHYWFFESQNDPSTDPLMLWLNGGPGCSSLLGLFTELGPFYIEADLTLGLRPYSWNRNASVIFLESPVCVGFSYDTNGDCVSGDTSTSLQNYLALQHFFQKFPEYSLHEFYITGESYAGIYIPTLAIRIIDGKDTFPVNFVGYAIGNGMLDYSSNDDSLMYFAHYHALVDEPMWDEMIVECCVDGDEGRHSCVFYDTNEPACRALVIQTYNIAYNSGINMYNLYGDCLYSQQTPYTGISREAIEKSNHLRRLMDRDLTRSDPPCLEYDRERAYLNTQEVKDAIHIPAVGPSDWDVCSDLPDYGREFENVTGLMTDLAANGIRALLYSGDCDMAVPFLGNQWDIEDLKFAVVEEQRTWWLNNQVAGFVKRFQDLDFVTVKGAGHMVPEDKPEQGFVMIMSYLFEVPLPN